MNGQAVSLRLHMEMIPLIILTKLTGCRLSGRGHFWPYANNVNKLGRGPLADVERNYPMITPLKFGEIPPSC